MVEETEEFYEYGKKQEIKTKIKNQKVGLFTVQDSDQRLLTPFAPS